MYHQISVLLILVHSKNISIIYLLFLVLFSCETWRTNFCDKHSKFEIMMLSKVIAFYGNIFGVFKFYVM